MRRRELLASVAGGVSLLAGCSSPSGSSDGSNADVAWPSVTDPRLERWERTGRRKKQHAAQGGVTPHERTYIYENSALRTEVDEKTLGQFDGTLATFFASHVDLRGLTTALASEERIGRNLMPLFEAELKRNGIENVRSVSPRKPKPSPSPGTEVYEFGGAYSTPEITKRVEIPNVGERTLSIEAGELQITGLVAVWKVESGRAFAAGGAFPAEPYDESDTISVTGEEGDGIDVTVSVDLGLRPGQLRREVIALTESVTTE